MARKIGTFRYKVCFKYHASLVSDFKKDNIAKSKDIVQYETKEHIKENKIVDAKVDIKNL